jgi:hypothetical protein
MGKVEKDLEVAEELVSWLNIIIVIEYIRFFFLINLFIIIMEIEEESEGENIC